MTGSRHQELITINYISDDEAVQLFARGRDENKYLLRRRNDGSIVLTYMKRNSSMAHILFTKSGSEYLNSGWPISEVMKKFKLQRHDKQIQAELNINNKKFEQIAAEFNIATKSYNNYDKNIQLGKAAIAYARTIAPTSATLPQQTKAERYPIAVFVTNMRDREINLSETVRNLYRVPANTLHNTFKIKVKGSKMFGVGNCDELANIALNYARKNNCDAEVVKIIDPRVDKLENGVIGGRHSFVIIGRKKGSDINKPKTWGESAVICDPLFNECYPASKIYKKLQCFINLDTEKKMGENELPNKYYPYTKNMKLEVVYETTTTINPDYNESVKYGTLYNLSRIMQSITDLNISKDTLDEYSSMIRNSSQLIERLKSTDLTMAQMEMTCNREIRGILKKIEASGNVALLQDLLIYKVPDILLKTDKEQSSAVSPNKVGSTTMRISQTLSKSGSSILGKRHLAGNAKQLKNPLEQTHQATKFSIEEIRECLRLDKSTDEAEKNKWVTIFNESVSSNGIFTPDPSPANTKLRKIAEIQNLGIAFKDKKSDAEILNQILKVILASIERSAFHRSNTAKKLTKFILTKYPNEVFPAILNVKFDNNPAINKKEISKLHKYILDIDQKMQSMKAKEAKSKTSPVEESAKRTKFFK